MDQGLNQARVDLEFRFDLNRLPRHRARWLGKLVSGMLEENRGLGDLAKWAQVEVTKLAFRCVKLDRIKSWSLVDPADFAGKYTEAVANRFVEEIRGEIRGGPFMRKLMGGKNA